MLEAIDLELQYGGRVLFRHGDMKFTNGNCYGIIGANGAGKSTLLKILSGEMEPTGGRVEKTPSERISILRQNHFEFDEYTALRTVLMGNKELCDIMDEKERLYAKADMTDEEVALLRKLAVNYVDENRRAKSFTVALHDEKAARR